MMHNSPGARDPHALALGARHPYALALGARHLSALAEIETS